MPFGARSPPGRSPATRIRRCRSDCCSSGSTPATLAGAPAPLPAEQSAADALLGPHLHEVLCDRLGGAWSECVHEGWAERHSEAAREREEPAALELRAAGGTLDLEAARERAELLASVGDGDAALAAWHAVLAMDPDDGQANFAVGSRLLASDDEPGLGRLDRVIASAPLLAARAAEVAAGWLTVAGRDADAARYRTRLDEQLGVLDAADAQRRDVGRRDVLLPHDLEPEAIAALSRSSGSGTSGERTSRASASRTLRTRWLRRRLKRIEGTQVYGR